MQMVRLFRQLQLIKLFQQLEMRQRIKRALAEEERARVAAGEVVPEGNSLAAAEAQAMAMYKQSESRVGQRLSGAPQHCWDPLTGASRTGAIERPHQL
jgi:hypothetical protein